MLQIWDLEEPIFFGELKESLPLNRNLFGIELRFALLSFRVIRLKETLGFPYHTQQGTESTTRL